LLTSLKFKVEVQEFGRRIQDNTNEKGSKTYGEDEKKYQDTTTTVSLTIAIVGKA